ncbi:phage major capsid protein [Solicola gregarius]|uniref:Phage major capsid protein n=1 Tax=Solicola gregarius TaxID=2908642 RepID=A0AA46YKR8_9ACTN|nr:phage major capsid protein [Solicola gregarius]UYM04213.1 phage major capsid protein [Solicola gregarius]
MAMYTSTDDVGGLLPEQIGALVVQPVLDGSVAAQTGTVVNVSSTSYRVPLVTEDPSAAWVAEGAEITPDDATMDELEVTPSKVAGLTIISRELAEDSSPAAQQVVGEGLARDISRKVDAAFFANTTSNGPAGLGSLTTSVVGGGWTNTDPFAEAISKAEAQGGSLNFFIASAADALTLAQVKKATGSNEPLLGASATEPGQRRILGVPLVVSSQLTAGTIWGIDSRFVQFVVRDNTRLEVDKSAYFSSDRVGVKATMRVAFAFTHPLALVKLTEDDESSSSSS